MLHSLNNQYPEELPDRIRLSNGLTRTGKDTFTAEEIADAGYVAVDNPPSISAEEQLSWDGSNWVVSAINYGAGETEESLLAAEWSKIRQVRDGTIQGVEWRVSRYLSEVRLGLTPTDDIVALDQYIQALRDVTNQTDPFNIVWPEPIV